MSAFASCCLLPTCRGLADKVGQEGNLGYHFLPTCHGLVRFCCQVMQWMYYLPRKLPKSRQVGSVKSRIMPTSHRLLNKSHQVCSRNYRILPTSHGLADKVGQEGNLGYHFLPTCHGLERFCCQVMRWMYYLPRKLAKSCQVGSVKSRIMPTCHGLLNKSRQVGNLGYILLLT